MLSHKFMPLFNGSIVTKKLGNIIDLFFRKLQEINRVVIHLNTSIVPQILRQNARRYFSDHSKMFFPVQNNFSIERKEKLGFITFKK